MDDVATPDDGGIKLGGKDVAWRVCQLRCEFRPGSHWYTDFTASYYSIR
jgi:hypothetical protein